MAEGGVTSRQEWHSLLTGLKRTVEGLLSTNTTNVWNMYGGLDRICVDMEKIMNHKLKAIKGPQGNCLDFWNFVCGLQWINPTMAPNIEQYHKLIRGGSPSHRKSGKRLGQMWLRQSLLDHNLSGQLHHLVSGTEHLQYHYEADAFLCQPNYYQAVLICLQAVELNKAALLAEINPTLLSRNYLAKDSNSTKSFPGRTRPRKVYRSLSSTLEGEDPRKACIYTEELMTDSSHEALGDAGDGSGENVDCRPDRVKHENDPLLNIQLIPTQETGNKPLKKSSSFSNPTYISSSNRSTASMKNSQSVSSGLLDRILNEDGDHASPQDEKESLKQELDVKAADINKDASLSDTVLFSDGATSQPASGETPVKRSYSHQRSVSDVGIRTIRSPSESVRSTGRLSKDPKRWQGTVPEDSPGFLSSSLPNVSKPDGVPYKKEGVFRKPAMGQSLLSFLSSQDFHTCAELDKENAHFTLAEGLISAIEQMKWNQIIRPQRHSDHEDGDSDEEIQQLKQRIRIRRRERMTEKARNFPSFFEDKRNDSESSRASPVNMSSNLSSHSQGSTSDSEDIHDQEIPETEESLNTNNNLVALKSSGLSLSMASLYSDLEIQRSNAHLEKNEDKQSSVTTVTETKNYNNVLLSAESVAISLLRRFSEKQLPKASELDWLVSEQDAPQQLLPLPDSYPISPDDSDATRIRGNMEWAPPRPQIIFNIHPPPRRKTVLAKQNYHCAGCGAKVEPGYTKRYRYCEYLGKYFCPCCHSNAVIYIPGHILRRWDFTKYYVSNFSHDLLRRIYKDPLFNIQDINPSLYRKVRPLDSVRESRHQLQHLTVFLKTCRLGHKLQDKLSKLPPHWTNDIHLYSVMDLIEIKKHEHVTKLKQLVNECIGHTAKCPLCQAKGFICEVCRNVNDIIFPFELAKVQTCTECRACFHKACYNPKHCPKCFRIAARRHQLKAELSPVEQEGTDHHSNVITDQKSHR